MLRLNLCFKECRVTQMQLVRATGYSKALISRALSKGELPVDSPRFIGAVVLFVEANEKMSRWLQERDLEPLALFDLVDAQGNTIRGQGVLKDPPVELDAAILAMVGRTVTLGPNRKDTMNLGRITLYLLEQLRQLPIGMDALGEIEVGAGRLLLQEMTS